MRPALVALVWLLSAPALAADALVQVGVHGKARDAFDAARIRDVLAIGPSMLTDAQFNALPPVCQNALHNAQAVKVVDINPNMIDSRDDIQTQWEGVREGPTGVLRWLMSDAPMCATEAAVTIQTCTDTGAMVCALIGEELAMISIGSVPVAPGDKLVNGCDGKCGTTNKQTPLAHFRVTCK